MHGDEKQIISTRVINHAHLEIYVHAVKRYRASEKNIKKIYIIYYQNVF